jgi:mono/diheme cytochrome c family protein
VVGPVAAPPRAPSAAYGAYIADYQDCRSCHGAALTGSAGGLGPPSPNARAFARAWTLEQFIATMRTGVDPDGRPVQEPMPWRNVGQMDDDELAALYLYLRSAP